MRVEDLIILLEDMPKDAEVSLALQPNYPMEHYICDVVEVDDQTVVITESGGNQYLSEEAVNACGW
jgi:hypothetical protein